MEHAIDDMEAFLPCDTIPIPAIRSQALFFAQFYRWNEEYRDVARRIQREYRSHDNI